MVAERFLRECKGLFIRGKFRDKEELIKVAKSQARALGMKGKIIVVDIGHYNSDLDGQSIIVESGREYNPPGSGSRGLTK